MWKSFAVGALGIYLLLVRLLRYRHRDAVLRKFPTKESYRFMTLDEAYEIQSSLVETEFPTVFSSSVFFALFKTYGIPSISRLLLATGQLAHASTASKRAADTAVIMTEVVLHHPSNPRAVAGLARMNALHAPYRARGQISDADLLYTLSLFVLEPVRWTARFEWRRVTEAERCALGVYWRFVGEAMEIPFAPLRSAGKGWIDGAEFLDELEEWSRGYEEAGMEYAESNRVVALATVEIGLLNVPKVLHGMAFELVSYLLDARLKAAMGFADASPWSIWIFDVVLALRRLLLRHFFLPRPYFLRWRWFDDEPSPSGRFHTVQYVSHPWYIRPGLWNRWGFNALLLRLTGGAIPGEAGGEAFHPEGYRIEEIGPERMRGKGEEEMRRTTERLKGLARFGCPFSRW